MTDVTPADDRWGPVLEALGSEVRESILRAGSEQPFASGTVLWTAGTASRGLYFVLEGRIRIVDTTDGRQHLVHTARQGDTIGEVVLFSGGGYPATAIAAGAARCLVVPSGEALRLVAEHPDFAALLLRRLSQRVRHLVQRLRGQTVGTVRARVAASLVGIATLANSHVAMVEQSQREWAEDLGTVREVLARELKGLKSAGIVRQLGPRRYEIVDADRLERLAEDLPATS